MKNVMKKKIFFGFLLMFLSIGFSAAAQPWWHTLEQGKRHFRDGAYGYALLSFEDARRQRRAMYEAMESDLIAMMSLAEVRLMGDSLQRVDDFARLRRYDRAAAALDEVYYRFPGNSFSNSATAALEALSSLKDYPEAEYWIGEIYRVEGELGLAISQFQRAHDMRPLLENPGFDVELLYKIAGIHKLRQEYTAMERTLLTILDNDTLWLAREEDGRVSAESFARNAMIRTLNNEGIGRFLTLYRYDNKIVELAHRELGMYYHATGRHNKAVEHLMFAFLIQNSTIIQEIIRQEFDFTFTSLEALLPYIQRSSLLAEYAENVEYYKTAFYLGSSLFGDGNTRSAGILWSFLASSSRSGEWQNRAISQLRQPRLEPAIEMP